MENKKLPESMRWGLGRKDVMSAVGFTWLGFYLPVDLSAVAREKKSWKLFAINTSYHFLMLLVAALILFYM